MSVTDKTFVQSLRANPTLWRLRVACFAQVVVLGLLLPFEGLWMKANGLGETTIGLLGGLATTVTFFSGIVWGIIADRTQKPNVLAIVGFIAASLVLFYFAGCQAVWHFAIYAVLIGLAMGLLMNMLPLLAVSVLGGSSAGRDYGLYRIFGSLGWITSTLVLSQLTADLKSSILLGAMLALLGPLPLLGFRFRPPQEHQHYVSIWRVMRNGRLAALYASVGFYALATPAIFRFTALYAELLGGDKNFVGQLMSINGMVALVGLPLTGILSDRFGCRVLILLALLAQPVRAFCYGLAPSHHWLLAPQVLHMFTWAGLEVAGMIYVSRTALPGNRATALAIFVGVQIAGRLVGAPVAGLLAEHVSYQAMYSLSAMAAVIGPIIFLAHWSIERRGQAGADPAQ
jgi:MFS family permease